MSQVIHDVVAQYAEEAAFLWLLRDGGVRAPHYLLADLARLDKRIDAHLDGLRANGKPGWEICRQQLEKTPEVGEVFAAAVLAYESGEPARIQKVEELGMASLEVLRGLISALGWLPVQQATPPILALLRASSPLQRGVGIAAAAIQRRDPPGTVLSDCLTDADMILRARALRSVGELGVVDLLPYVRPSLRKEDPECRFWSAWSMALLARDPDALQVLRTVALARGPLQETAVQLVLRADEPSVAKRLSHKLQEEPAHRRAAAQAAGVFGDPDAIPWLIEQMAVPEVARVAGEALTMITGVHIAYDKLEGDKPQGFEAGPTENPEDEKVAMDEDLNLAWPDPQKVGTWWQQNQGRFSRGIRYLAGQSLNENSLRAILREGWQRQRAAAALELALRHPEKGLFEVRAPGFRQQQLLQKTS